MNTQDSYRMPPLARNMIDRDAAQVLDDWINSLPGSRREGLACSSKSRHEELCPAPKRGRLLFFLLTIGTYWLNIYSLWKMWANQGAGNARRKFFWIAGVHTRPSRCHPSMMPF